MNPTRKYKTLDVANFGFLTRNFKDAQINEDGTELHFSLDKHQAMSFEWDFPGIVLHPV